MATSPRRSWTWPARRTSPYTHLGTALIPDRNIELLPAKPAMGVGSTTRIGPLGAAPDEQPVGRSLGYSPEHSTSAVPADRDGALPHLCELGID